jgi:ferric iron reductase protein FhuF
MLACMRGSQGSRQVQVVKLLMGAGADIQLQDKVRNERDNGTIIRRVCC